MFEIVSERAETTDAVLAARTLTPLELAASETPDDAWRITCAISNKSPVSAGATLLLRLAALTETAGIPVSSTEAVRSPNRSGALASPWLTPFSKSIISACANFAKRCSMASSDSALSASFCCTSESKEPALLLPP